MSAGLIKDEFRSTSAGLIKYEFRSTSAGLIKDEFRSTSAGLIKDELRSTFAGLVNHELRSMSAGQIKDELRSTSAGLIQNELKLTSAGLKNFQSTEFPSGSLSCTYDEPVNINQGINTSEETTRCHQSTLDNRDYWCQPVSQSQHQWTGNPHYSGIPPHHYIETPNGYNWRYVEPMLPLQLKPLFPVQPQPSVIEYYQYPVINLQTEYSETNIRVQDYLEHYYVTNQLVNHQTIIVDINNARYRMDSNNIQSTSVDSNNFRLGPSLQQVNQMNISNNNNNNNNCIWAGNNATYPIVQPLSYQDPQYRQQFLSLLQSTSDTYNGSYGRLSVPLEQYIQQDNAYVGSHGRLSVPLEQCIQQDNAYDGSHGRLSVPLEQCIQQDNAYDGSHGRLSVPLEQCIQQDNAYDGSQGRISMNLEQCIQQDNAYDGSQGRTSVPLEQCFQQDNAYDGSQGRTSVPLEQCIQQDNAYNGSQRRTSVPLEQCFQQEGESGYIQGYSIELTNTSAVPQYVSSADRMFPMNFETSTVSASNDAVSAASSTEELQVTTSTAQRSKHTGMILSFISVNEMINLYSYSIFFTA